MTTITAVVESGLLRPTTPLALAEGTRVELLIVGNGGGARPQGRAAASILAEIAALPTAGGDPATSHNHDRILDGELASPHPLAAFAGMLKGDPSVKAWKQAMADDHRKHNSRSDKQ